MRPNSLSAEWHRYKEIHADASELANASVVLFDKGNALHEKAQKYLVNCAEAEKLRAHGDMLTAKGDLISAKANKLHAKANLFWAQVVVNNFGNIEIRWINGDCRLGNGEVYEIEGDGDE